VDSGLRGVDTPALGPGRSPDTWQDSWRKLVCEKARFYDCAVAGCTNVARFDGARRDNVGVRDAGTT
jgi:hypothetical protein